MKLKFKSFSLDLSIVKAIYKVGFPAMVMQFLASFMMAGMNKILAGYTPTAVWLWMSLKSTFERMESTEKDESEESPALLTFIFF